MPIDPVSEEALREVIEAREKHVSGHEAARSLGLPESTFRQRLKIAAKRGLYQPAGVPPGFEIAKLSETRDANDNLRSRSIQMKPEREGGFNLPPGHAIKGLSTLLDADGRVVQQWMKTKAEVDPLDAVEAIKEAFASFEPAAPAQPKTEADYVDLLTLYAWADPHFGLYSWRGDAAENWDLKIAVQVVRDTFRKVVERTPKTKKAILLVGGDATHQDSQANVTPNSGHQLDVDGRYPKVLLTACETIVRNTDLILSNHEEVELIVIPGNHDMTTAHAITFFLHAWYRNEPRVKVDTSPSLFRFREYGRVMLASTHGHAAKGRDMPAVMAAREPESWGRTRFRFCHLFHVHHASKVLSEGGGVICETHQIIAPQDAWHYGQGFVSGRSLQSICYDRELGEVSRARVAIV